MRSRAQLGAGPDLLITRVTPAEVLEREGHLKSVAIEPQRLNPLRLMFLSEFQDGGGHKYMALPFLLQPNVACFDRRRVPKAPATLSELTRQASQGVKVGLPLNMSELLWSVSAFDADRPLLALFRTSVQPGTRWQGLTPTDRIRLETWLTWLYRANLEPNVIYLDTADDLVQQLETGKLSWISCNSSAVKRLQRKLGDHLGVSVLPRGKTSHHTRATTRFHVLSFGRDSSMAQQEAATNFALFVLNDISQTSLMEKSFGNMPVNGNVVIPVKDSSALAAINSSLQHATIPTFRQGVSGIPLPPRAGD